MELMLHRNFVLIFVLLYKTVYSKQTDADIIFVKHRWMDYCSVERISITLGFEDLPTTLKTVTNNIDVSESTHTQSN